MTVVRKCFSCRMTCKQRHLGNGEVGYVALPVQNPLGGSMAVSSRNSMEASVAVVV